MTRFRVDADLFLNSNRLAIHCWGPWVPLILVLEVHVLMLMHDWGAILRDVVWGGMWESMTRCLQWSSWPLA